MFTSAPCGHKKVLSVNWWFTLDNSRTAAQGSEARATVLTTKDVYPQ